MKNRGYRDHKNNKEHPPSSQLASLHGDTCAQSFTNKNILTSCCIEI